MNIKPIVAIILTISVLLFANLINSYEDQTHQALTRRAIKIAMLNDTSIPPEFNPDDPTGLGIKVIAGAGAPESEGKHAGEDYTDYEIITVNEKCPIIKKADPSKSIKEPMNHFAEKMLLGEPASIKMVKLFRDAIDLWKHGDKEGAAFIIGRCCHLIEDMAQPQHAMNEWHPDKNYLPGIKDISFLEEFTEAAFNGSDETNYCHNSYYNYPAKINDANVVVEQIGTVINLNDMISKSKTAADGYVISDGAFDGRKISNLFPDIYPLFHFCDWVDIGDGNFKCSCASLFLPFQNSQPRCSGKLYLYGNAFKVDETNGACNQETSGVGNALRIDLATKLHQARLDKLTPDNFGDEHMSKLLSPAIGYSAGVIVAFWNEVKDSGTQDCGPVIVLKHDFPDDAVFVKSSTVSTGAGPAHDDWKAACRVGIGRGLSTMADYGVSSSLMDRISALTPASDPSAAQALYDRLDGFMAKYSGPQNMMPAEVEDAPQVAVAQGGFCESARSLFEGLQEPVRLLEQPQERVLTDERSMSILPPKRGLLDADAGKQKILVLPTGSLFGMRKGSIEHAVLESYVEQGGTIVCFTQAFGDDFSALPVPDGEELLAAGFNQDVSCFKGSAYPVMDHPILSGISTLTMGSANGQYSFRPGITAGFDGFFRKLPSGSTVLLRRTVSGEPCLAYYPVGSGYVVVTTMYEDWGFSDGLSTKDGRSVVSNILSWAKDPGADIPAVNISEGGDPSAIIMDLYIRNLSGTPSDQVEVIVMTPDRKEIALRRTIALTVAAHSETSLSAALDMSGYFAGQYPSYGIFHADYRLLAVNPSSGLEEEIQPQGETVSGRFIVQKPDEVIKGLSDTVFSIWTDSDVAGDPSAAVHFHLEDHTGTARTLHLWRAWNHSPGTLVKTIELSASGNINFDMVQDLSLPGSYRYFLMDPSYGIPTQSFGGGEWSIWWGKDPWKIAGMGALSMADGRANNLVEIGQIGGLSGTPYGRTDMVAGIVPLTNRMGRPVDFTVVANLAASGQTITSTKNIHLEANQSGTVEFALSLQEVTSFAVKADIQAMVYMGPIFMGSASAKVDIKNLYPKISITPEWPFQPDAASFGTISVNIGNGTGEDVGIANCTLKAAVLDQTFALIEEQTVDLPLLNPGDSKDIEVLWTKWRPVSGGIYTVMFSIKNNYSNTDYWGELRYRTIDFASPSPKWVNGEALPGEPAVKLQGQIINAGDLSWNGEVIFDCQALGSIPPQAVAVGPKSTVPVKVNIPRPENLSPGNYPVTMHFNSEGLTDPLIVTGSLQVPNPSISVSFPQEPPAFRHDNDTVVPIKITMTNAAGPVAALLDATMNWNGGSVPVISQQAVTLDPEHPSGFDLTLPVPQVPAPQTFSIDLKIFIPQGNVSYYYRGDYQLAGPKYETVFSPASLAPGEILMCSIRNDGDFEGNCQAIWSLYDSNGNMIAQDQKPLALPIGGLTTFNETMLSVLPGIYRSELSIKDTLTNRTTRSSAEVRVLGGEPSITISTDREIYGDLGPVNLGVHIGDEGSILEGSGLHASIERYIGMGGQTTTSDKPGAGWNTPRGDLGDDHMVAPSGWFHDPLHGREAYVEDYRWALPDSDITFVSADINDDKMADIISMKNGVLLVMTSGTISDGEPQSRKGIWNYYSYPVGATWGIEADAWTDTFMLGVKNDRNSNNDQICIGMLNHESNKAMAMLVKLDGSVLWKRDFDNFIDSNWRGPVFADLNGDGADDILLRDLTEIYTINGVTGELLWQYSVASDDFDIVDFKIGYGGSAPYVWVYIAEHFWIGSENRIILFDPSGGVSYQYSYQDAYTGDIQTGDVDGDGQDEAVIAGGNSSNLIFNIEDPEPMASSAICPQFMGWISGISDINNDGREEVILTEPAGTVESSDFNFLALDVISGQTIWNVDQLPDTYFMALYETPSSRKKMLLLGDYCTGDCNLEDWFSRIKLVDAQTGIIEQELEYPEPSEFGNISAGDYNGDGISEFIWWGNLIGGGCSLPDGTAGPCEEWVTVWENDRTVNENDLDNIDMDYQPGAMKTAGTYRAAARLSTVNGQFMNAEPKGFSVVSTNLGISTEPAAGKIVRTDDLFTGGAALKNLGVVRETAITLKLSVDGIPFASWQVEGLDPDMQEDHDFTLPPMAAGKHELLIQAVENGEIAAETRSAFISSSPEVEVIVSAPEYHLDEPFDIAVTARNSGDVAARVELAMNDQLQDPVSIDLLPQETAVRTFTRQGNGSYEAQMEISGDVQKTVPVSVPNGYDIVLTVADMAPLPMGEVKVPVRISQSGPAAYDGTITAVLSSENGGSQTLSIPVHVNSNDTEDASFVFPVDASGPVHLIVSASSSPYSVQKDFFVYSRGMGTIGINLPDVSREGLVQIPFVLKNDLSSEGIFKISLVSGSTPATLLAEEIVDLPPLGSASGFLSPVLTAHVTSLTVLLNGIEATSKELTIIPDLSAELYLESEDRPDLVPSLTATVLNNGYAPMDANLVVFTGTAGSYRIHLDRGASFVQNIQYDPDGFGSAGGSVSAVLYLPDGKVISKNIEIPLKPAQIEVTLPSLPVTIYSGSNGQLPFIIRNGGDISSEIVAHVDFHDGDVGRFEQTATVPGHGSGSVDVQVPLAADIPNGRSTAHYLIRSKEGDGLIAEGDLPVLIKGPSVEVSASIDGVSYPSGSQANLSLSFSRSADGASPISVNVLVTSGTYEIADSVLVADDETRTYPIPVGESADNISVDVFLPTGRSIYINRFRIYAMNDGFSIHPDRSFYSAGENILVSAVLPSPGALHLSFRGEEAALTGIGELSHSFQVPGDVPENSYMLYYEYVPDDPDAEPSYGSMPVDVHGIIMTAGESFLEKVVYSSGENIAGQVVIYSNQAAAGNLKFWLMEPDGNWSYLGEQAATTFPDVPLRRSFSFPFSSLKSGSHTLAFAFVGGSQEIYVGGSLPFTAGNGALLSMSTSRPCYPEGDEPVEVSIRTSGYGNADLSVFLDGSLVNQQALILDGVESNNYPIGSVSAKNHTLKAVLVDGSGHESQSFCNFIYGSQLPDLTGYVSEISQNENTVRLAVLVQNKGVSAAPSFSAALYDGYPGEGGSIIGSMLLPSIGPGGTASQIFDWDISGQPGQTRIYASIDPQGQVREWDETNNISSTLVIAEQKPIFMITPDEGSCSRTGVTPAFSVDREGFALSATMNGSPFTPGTSETEEGDYTLTVTATNTAGSTFSEIRHFSIDSTPPVVLITVPSENGCMRPPAIPQAEAVDPHDVSLSFELNGEPYIMGTPVMAEGEYTLAVRGEDACGNTSGQEVRKFTLDGTPPVIEIASPAEEETVDPGFVPVILGEDLNGVSYDADLDGHSYIIGTPVTDGGAHILAVSASDDCGNISPVLTRHFSVGGQTAPFLPSSVNRFALFGCESLNVSGNVKLCAVHSVGGPQGFGGHIGSNGDIRVNGSNFINGNASPGPGRSVVITGSQDQVSGSKAPAPAELGCGQQDVSMWADYARANNSNSQIPTGYMDGQGNLKISGSKTCTLPSGFYCVSSLTVEGKSKLAVNGAAAIVVCGAVTIGGNSVLNQGGDPRNLLLVASSQAPVAISGGTKACLQVYAPLSPITVGGNVEGCGNLWGRTLNAGGHAVWNRLKDDSAPALIITSPADGSTVEERRPEISVSYKDTAGGTGVNERSLKVLLDGADITGVLIIGPDKASGIPQADLGSGDHSLAAQIEDHDGNLSNAQSNFTTW